MQIKNAIYNAQDHRMGVVKPGGHLGFFHSGPTSPFRGKGGKDGGSKKGRPSPEKPKSKREYEITGPTTTKDAPEKQWTQILKQTSSDQFIKSPANNSAMKRQNTETAAEREEREELEEMPGRTKIPMKRTFDNRLVEDIPTQQDPKSRQKFQAFYPQKFDFNSYEFIESEGNQVQAADYRKQFMSATSNSVNKRSIQKSLMDLLYNQVSNLIEDRVSAFPKLMENNKTQFCRMMIKSPKMQNFFEKFTTALNNIMHEELMDNKQSLDLYMGHPRARKSFTRRSAEEKYLYPEVEAYTTYEERLQAEQILQEAKTKYNYLEQRKKLLHRKTAKQLAQEKQKHEKAAASMKNVTEVREFNLEIHTRELERQKEKLPPKKQRILTEYENQIKARTKQIEDYIASIDKENNELKEVVVDTEQEVERLGNEIKGGEAAVPGARIEQLMLKWGAEPHYPPGELKHFKNLLWLSLEQFEQQLEREETGQEIEYKMMVDRYEGRIRRLQDAACFRFEALESALADTQIAHVKERESHAMYRAEVESNLLNQYKTADQLDELVQQCDDKLILRSVGEAREIINKLVRTLKDNHSVIQQFEINARHSEVEASKAQERLDEATRKGTIESALRKYYQYPILKLSRDLNLFEGDQKKKEKFDTINEHRDDLEDQQEIKEVLDKVEFSSLLLCHANQHIGHVQGIKKIKDHFARLDTVNAQGARERVAFKNDMADRIVKAQAGYLDQAVVTETSGAPTAPLVAAQAEEERRQKKLIKGKPSGGKANKIVKGSTRKLVAGAAQPPAKNVDPKAPDKSQQKGEPQSKRSGQLPTQAGKNQERENAEDQGDDKVQKAGSSARSSQGGQRARRRRRQERSRKPKEVNVEGTSAQTSRSLTESDSEDVSSSSQRSESGREAGITGYSAEFKDYLQEQEAAKLQGICQVNYQLNQLNRSKYKKLEDEVKQVLAEDQKAFTMKAKKVGELQEFVQGHLNVALGWDDYNGMYQADLNMFFNAFNRTIVREYSFQEMNDYLSLNGKVDPKKDKKNEKKQKHIQFGDVLKPVFSITGGFMGLQVRPNMARSIFLDSDFSVIHLKRIMKICIYVNRLMRDGRDREFAMKEFGGSAKDAEYSLPKSVDIQVDVEELKMYNEMYKDESAKSINQLQHGGADQQLLYMLKNHAIDILTRTSPEKQDFYKVVWAKADFERILSYKLDRVYKTKEDFENSAVVSSGINFKAYLEYILQSFSRKIQEGGLTYDQKQDLVIYDLLQSGSRSPISTHHLSQRRVEPATENSPRSASRSVIPLSNVIERASRADQGGILRKSSAGTSSATLPAGMETKGIQAAPQVSNASVNTDQKNLQWQVANTAQSIAKKSLHQLSLDSAMEEELSRTIEMFDLFVDLQGRVNFHKVQKGAIRSSLSHEFDAETFDQLYNCALSAEKEKPSKPSPRQQPKSVFKSKDKSRSPDRADKSISPQRLRTKSHPSRFSNLRQKDKSASPRGEAGRTPRGETIQKIIEHKKNTLEDLPRIRDKLQKAIDAMVGDIKEQDAEPSRSPQNQMTQSQYGNDHLRSSLDYGTSLGQNTQAMNYLEHASTPFSTSSYFIKDVLTPPNIRPNMTAGQDFGNPRDHIMTADVVQGSILKVIKQSSRRKKQSKDKSQNISLQLSPQHRKSIPLGKTIIENIHSPSLMDTISPLGSVLFEQQMRQRKQKLKKKICNFAQFRERTIQNSPRSDNKMDVFSSEDENTTDVNRQTLDNLNVKVKKSKKSRRRTLFNQSVDFSMASNLQNGAIHEALINNTGLDSTAAQWGAAANQTGSKVRNNFKLRVMFPDKASGVEGGQLNERLSPGQPQMDQIFQNQFLRLNEQSRDIQPQGPRATNYQLVDTSRTVLPPSIINSVNKANEAKRMQWPDQNHKKTWEAANEMKARDLEKERKKKLNYTSFDSNRSHATALEKQRPSPRSTHKQKYQMIATSLQNHDSIQSQEQSNSNSINDVLKIERIGRHNINSQLMKAVSNDFKNTPAAKNKIHLSLFSALNLLPAEGANEMRTRNNDDNFSDYLARASGTNKNEGHAKKTSQTEANSQWRLSPMGSDVDQGINQWEANPNEQIKRMKRGELNQWDGGHGMKSRLPNPSAARGESKTQAQSKTSDDTRR